MTLEEMLRQIRDKGRKPTYAPEPGPRGGMLSEKARIGPSFIFASPESVQPNDPQFRPLVASPVDDYYFDIYGKGPMGDVDRPADLRALQEQAMQNNDLARYWELEQARQMREFEMRKAPPTEIFAEDESQRLTSYPYTATEVLPLAQRGAAEVTEEFVPMFALGAGLTREQPEAAAWNLIQSLRQDDKAKKYTEERLETLRKLPTIQPKYNELGEKAGEAWAEEWDKYQKLKAAGRTEEAVAVRNAAFGKFKEEYPEVPDFYWTAGEIALETGVFLGSNLTKTAMTQLALRLPRMVGGADKVIRPFIRAFGETVGIPDTLENAFTRGIIKSLIGTTRYGRDVYRLLSRGEGRAFDPEQHEMLRARRAEFKGITDPRHAREQELTRLGKSEWEGQDLRIQGSVTDTGVPRYPKGQGDPTIKREPPITPPEQKSLYDEYAEFRAKTPPPPLSTLEGEYPDTRILAQQQQALAEDARLAEEARFAEEARRVEEALYDYRVRGKSPEQLRLQEIGEEQKISKEYDDFTKSREEAIPAMEDRVDAILDALDDTDEEIIQALSRATGRELRDPAYEAGQSVVEVNVEALQRKYPGWYQELTDRERRASKTYPAKGKPGTFDKSSFLIVGPSKTPRFRGKDFTTDPASSFGTTIGKSEKLGMDPDMREGGRLSPTDEPYGPLEYREEGGSQLLPGTEPSKLVAIITEDNKLRMYYSADEINLGMRVQAQPLGPRPEGQLSGDLRPLDELGYGRQQEVEVPQELIDLIRKREALNSEFQILNSDLEELNEFLSEALFRPTRGQKGLAPTPQEIEQLDFLEREVTNLKRQKQRQELLLKRPRTPSEFLRFIIAVRHGRETALANPEMMARSTSFGGEVPTPWTREKIGQDVTDLYGPPSQANVGTYVELNLWSKTRRNTTDVPVKVPSEVLDAFEEYRMFERYMVEETGRPAWNDIQEEWYYSGPSMSPNQYMAYTMGRGENPWLIRPNDETKTIYLQSKRRGSVTEVTDPETEETWFYNKAEDERFQEYFDSEKKFKFNRLQRIENDLFKAEERVRQYQRQVDRSVRQRITPERVPPEPDLYDEPIGPIPAQYDEPIGPIPTQYDEPIGPVQAQYDEPVGPPVFSYEGGPPVGPPTAYGAGLPEYGPKPPEGFSQRRRDDIHDKITGGLWATADKAGKVFDSAMRGIARGAEQAVTQATGKRRKPSFVANYEKIKNNVFRLEGGAKKSLADREIGIRNIAQRGYRNVDNTADIKKQFRDLENQLATKANYKGKARATWRILLQQLSRRAPDIDFNDMEEYSYLQAAKDAITREGDGNVKINIARQGEENKIITTREEVNAAITEFTEKFDTNLRKNVVDGVTGAETEVYVNPRMQLDEAHTVMKEHIASIRENMVFTGRLSRGIANDMSANSPSLNPLYQIDEQSQLYDPFVQTQPSLVAPKRTKYYPTLKRLPSRFDGMNDYQKLIGISSIRDTNNRLFLSIIDAAQLDVGPMGIARSVKKLTQEEVSSFTLADYEEAIREGLDIYDYDEMGRFQKMREGETESDFLVRITSRPPKRPTETMTFFRDGVEETWQVPKELVELWGAANQFGFDDKAMIGVVGVTNLFRVSATQVNPTFINRAFAADIWNYMSHEEKTPLHAAVRMGHLGASRIAYELGAENTVYERVRDVFELRGGSQEKTRGIETAGIMAGKTRAAEAGKPVSLDDSDALRRYFSTSSLRETAEEQGYTVVTNEKDAMAMVGKSLGITLRAPVTAIKGGLDALQWMARKNESAARLLTAYKVLDSEEGGTIRGGFAIKTPSWASKSSMELARSQAGQEAAARAVDITLNFDRGGTAIKQMNTYIPFLNSTFEGAKHPWRRLFYGPTRGTTAMNLGYLMAADTAITAHNMSYPEYMDIDTKTRWGSIFWITGYKTDSQGNYIEDANGKRQIDVAVYLPRLWNWGGLLAIRTIMHEMIYQNDPSQETNAELVDKLTGDLPTWLRRTQYGINTLRNVTEDPFGIAKETLAEGLPEFGRQQAPIQIRGETPTDTALNIFTQPGLRAALSWVFNRNYYFGSDVVPEGMRDMPKEEQYLPGTPRPYVEAGALTGQSPLQIQQLVNDLFGGGAKAPVDIFDKVIDLISPAYTEENLKDFTDWATANRRERAELETDRTDEWVNLMRRMARDPDLEQFDVARLAEQAEEDPRVGSLGDLFRAPLRPFTDVFTPEQRARAGFAKGVEEVEKQTPFSFEDSNAVSGIMREWDNNMRTRKIELQNQLNRNDITWETWQQQALADISLLRREELKRLEDLGKYPNAVQFAEIDEQAIADKSKYFSLLAAEGILPDTRERGEIIYRSINDIATDIELLGANQLIENPHYGKRLKEIQQKVAALSPEDRNLYRQYENSQFATSAEKERKNDLNAISDSGYWQAGVEEFKTTMSVKYSARKTLIEKWLDSSKAKQDSLEKLEGTDEEQAFYTMLSRAYLRSSSRRRARRVILKDNPEIEELLIKHGYREQSIPDADIDEVSGYRRMLVGSLTR
mgnify:CR=1 FL=1